MYNYYDDYDDYGDNGYFCGRCGDTFGRGSIKSNSLGSACPTCGASINKDIEAVHAHWRERREMASRPKPKPPVRYPGDVVATIMVIAAFVAPFPVFEACRHFIPDSWVTVIAPIATFFGLIIGGYNVGEAFGGPSTGSGGGYREDGGDGFRSGYGNVDGGCG